MQETTKEAFQIFSPIEFVRFFPSNYIKYMYFLIYKWKITKKVYILQHKYKKTKEQNL